MTESTQTIVEFLFYAAIVVIGCGWLVIRHKITRIEFVVCLVIVIIFGAILYPIYKFEQYQEVAIRESTVVNKFAYVDGDN